jgi:hypothetical protein
MLDRFLNGFQWWHAAMTSHCISKGFPTLGQMEISYQKTFISEPVHLSESNSVFDGSLQPSLGCVSLWVSFGGEPSKGTYVHFEVMKDCQHDEILGRNFVFENDVYDANVHRLVDVDGDTGLNCVTLLPRQKLNGMSDMHMHILDSDANQLVLRSPYSRRQPQTRG